MKNSLLIKLIWWSCSMILLIVLGAYYLKFGESGLSDKQEVWAQFGDYLGGVLNPFISIINLIILAYLSIRLVKDEDERNKWTLKELARPFGEFTFSLEKEKITITLENIGLGPLIFKEILIKTPENTESSFNFIEEKLGPLGTYNISHLQCTHGRSAIGKDQQIILLQLKCDTEMIKKMIPVINSCTIEIPYFDMYDQKISTLSQSTTFDTDDI